jgi:hypothetical protein
VPWRTCGDDCRGAARASCAFPAVPELLPQRDPRRACSRLRHQPCWGRGIALAKKTAAIGTRRRSCCFVLYNSFLVRTELRQVLIARRAAGARTAPNQGGSRSRSLLRLPGRTRGEEFLSNSVCASFPWARPPRVPAGPFLMIPFARLVLRRHTFMTLAASDCATFAPVTS